jgi:outer membrane protein assembly factor BamB
VFIGNYPGTVYAFDARSGHKLWSKGIGGTISGSPTVIGGGVYVSSLSAHHTWAFAPRTGRVLWEFSNGRYVTGIATHDAIYLSTGVMLSRWTSAQSERRARVAERRPRR